MNAIEEAAPRVNAHNVDSTSEIVVRNAFVQIFHRIRLLLIAMWLGAALFFGAAVAPSAFAVLAASREQAGAIVSRTLAVLNTSGFVISLLLLLASVLAYKSEKRKAIARVEIIALLLVALATGTGQWIITARLEQLRVSMKRPVELVAAIDPLRIAFGQWHVYSVITLGVALLAGFVAFFSLARRRDDVNS